MKFFSKVKVKDKKKEKKVYLEQPVRKYLDFGEKMGSYFRSILNQFEPLGPGKKPRIIRVEPVTTLGPEFARGPLSSRWFEKILYEFIKEKDIKGDFKVEFEETIKDDWYSGKICGLIGFTGQLDEKDKKVVKDYAERTYSLLN